MFTYNDGKLHETVEVFIESPVTKLKLERIVGTTQYVAPSSTIYQYRHTPLIYKHVVDNKPTERKKNDPLRFKPLKKLFGSTPYIHAIPHLQAKTLIYIIPGNPGLCEYYIELVEALVRLVPYSEVVAISHLGMNVDQWASESHIASLDEQVAHKSQFLTFLLENRPLKPQVIVLGHSMGAWIAQRVASLHREVSFVGLLTPTIHNIALSKSGHEFTQLTKFVGPYMLYWFVFFLQYLFFMEKIVKFVVDWKLPPSVVGKEARDASMKLARHPAACRQLLGMAIEEMDRINGDIKPPEIFQFWDTTRVWGCFAENDKWVSEETREKLFEFAKLKPNVRMDLVPLPHAFCLSQSEAMAGLAARQINEWIASM